MPFIRKHAAGDAWKAALVLAGTAEQGSAAAAHNLAWLLLQRAPALAAVPGRGALAQGLLLRGARLDGYPDGLVDAALLAYHGDRCGFRVSWVPPPCRACTPTCPAGRQLLPHTRCPGGVLHPQPAGPHTNGLTLVLGRELLGGEADPPT